MEGDVMATLLGRNAAPGSKKLDLWPQFGIRKKIWKVFSDRGHSGGCGAFMML